MLNIRFTPIRNSHFAGKFWFIKYEIFLSNFPRASLKEVNKVVRNMIYNAIEHKNVGYTEANVHIAVCSTTSGW